MGTDGRTPASWADGECRWDGYYPPEAAPRIVDPDRGFVWTANARVVGGEPLAKLGFGGYDKGARGAQIRDSLQALPSATEADLLQIQLDDRALFLEHRWHGLLLELLSPAAIAQSPGRAELRTATENWGGRASVDSVGYRLVCEFRLRVIHHLLSALTGPCQEADPRFNIRLLPQLEGVAWTLVRERPRHLLPPGYQSWDQFLLAMADGLSPNGDASRPLAERTWGKLNTVRVRHPLSQAVPLLSRWLDMPARELPGGWADVPRIQRPRFGASQRMVVGPGRETEGIFHMPGGQSGHPLSAHYGNGQQDWEEGNPSAFIPGETQFTLTLRPGR
jgi:penicillin amidase